MIFLAAAALLGVGISPTTASNSDAHRFTLACQSQNPNAPIHEYIVDVNLDLRSYYIDTRFGGLDEVDSAHEDRILFRHNGRDVHGLPMFILIEYDRTSGGWYNTVGFDYRHHAGAKPDAICKMIPAREKFMADRKYDAPNQ
jgi:hypothetical protein